MIRQVHSCLLNLHSILQGNILHIDSYIRIKECNCLGTYGLLDLRKVLDFLANILSHSCWSLGLSTNPDLMGIYLHIMLVSLTVCIDQPDSLTRKFWLQLMPMYHLDSS